MYYRISQRIGDHFNLANWWFVNTLPKLNRQFFLVSRLHNNDVIFYTYMHVLTEWLCYGTSSCCKLCNLFPITRSACHCPKKSWSRLIRMLLNVWPSARTEQILEKVTTDIRLRSVHRSESMLQRMALPELQSTLARFWKRKFQSYQLGDSGKSILRKWRNSAARSPMALLWLWKPCPQRIEEGHMSWFG